MKLITELINELKALKKRGGSIDRYEIKKAPGPQGFVLIVRGRNEKTSLKRLQDIDMHAVIYGRCNECDEPLMFNEGETCGDCLCPE